MLKLVLSNQFHGAGAGRSAEPSTNAFGGHECTNVPLNVAACDHLEESMFPIETLAKEYVVVARSFGFTPRFVFRNYIFRNALIPYVTVIGLQVRYLLGGVVVIERIFGIQGLGSLAVDAAFARDYPTVQACTVIFLGVVLTVNVLVDLACAALDPRRSL